MSVGGQPTAADLLISGAACDLAPSARFGSLDPYPLLTAP